MQVDMHLINSFSAPPSSDPSVAGQLFKDGTNREGYSLQRLVMSQIIKTDLLRLFGNKWLKVTDKQCGQSVCQRAIKQCALVYLCVSTPPSLCVTFSDALCTEHAKRPLSGRNSLILGFCGQTEQCSYWWKSDTEWQERDSLTEETETDLQLLSDYN